MNIEFIDCNDGKKLESGDFIFFKCADGVGGFYKNLKIIELTLKDNEFIFKVENKPISKLKYTLIALPIFAIVLVFGGKDGINHWILLVGGFVVYRMLEDYFTEKKTYTITTQPDTKTYNEIVNFLT